MSVEDEARKILLDLGVVSGKLRSAATASRTFADAVDDVRGPVNQSASSIIHNNTGESIEAFDKLWTQIGIDAAVIAGGVALAFFTAGLASGAAVAAADLVIEFGAGLGIAGAAPTTPSAAASPNTASPRTAPRPTSPSSPGAAPVSPNRPARTASSPRGTMRRTPTVRSPRPTTRAGRTPHPALSWPGSPRRRPPRAAPASTPSGPTPLLVDPLGLECEEAVTAPRTGVKGLLKDAQLPHSGRIRFGPPKDLSVNSGLPRGTRKGYIDRFGNN